MLFAGLWLTAVTLLIKPAVVRDRSASGRSPGRLLANLPRAKQVAPGGAAGGD
jgi:hypothetical protein